jgi:hypothetical protein
MFQVVHVSKMAGSAALYDGNGGTPSFVISVNVPIAVMRDEDGEIGGVVVFVWVHRFFLPMCVLGSGAYRWRREGEGDF